MKADEKPLFIEEFIDTLKWKLKERIKELDAIKKTATLISQNTPLPQLIKELCEIIPAAYQYVENTSCRITINNHFFSSQNFIKESQYFQKVERNTLNNEKVIIEVFIDENFASTLENELFLKEEEDLLNNISILLVNYINNLKAKELILKNNENLLDINFLLQKHKQTKSFLQQYLNQTFNYLYYSEEIYKYKVKHVLIISSLYDIYSITSEYFMRGNKHEDNFFLNMPILYGATTENEIIDILNIKKIDLIILIHGIDYTFTQNVLKLFKQNNYNIPVYVLFNNEKDLTSFEKNNLKELYYKSFIWSSDIFLLITIFKLTEDLINIEEDLKIAGVPIILVIEDSPSYYSKILTKVYQTIFKEILTLKNELSLTESTFNYKFRPKILHYTTFSKAYNFYQKYKDLIFIIITDIEANTDSLNNSEDNLKYIEDILKESKHISLLAHSSDEKYRKKIYELGGIFLNKNSKSFYNDLKDFVEYNLYISHFRFITTDNKVFGIAKNIKDFINLVVNIPNESLIFHASKNHFALWFFTLGEYKISKILFEYKVSNFKNVDELRSFLINIIHKYKIEQEKGKIIEYDESAITDERNIVLLKGEAIGGKARGLAFLNTLIHNFDLSLSIPGIIIKTLPTMIIGTEEFDAFMFRHKLYKKIKEINDYKKLREVFLKCELSNDLMNKLRAIVKQIKTPLAIRSSSMLEDSSSYPFSGIFETYLIPNSHPDEKERIEQIADAIKLIYSSVFSPQALSYFETINFSYESEKMAIVIQSVTGKQYENYFFPHISGTAQSYSYYSIGNIEPKYGLASLAIGLGQYVVDGEKTFKFCPSFPKVDLISIEDLLNESQTFFYAINLKNKKPNLIEGEYSSLVKLDLYDAERLGILNHIASVYDYQNERLDTSLKISGPRIINFADILKYNYIPLADAIKFILDIGENTMKTPVEIEFSVDLSKDNIYRLPTLYLLQIKPLIGKDDFTLNNRIPIDKEKIIIFSEKVMGNGIIDYLSDIIVVNPEKFNSLVTEKIVKEIEEVNTKFLKEHKEYILIGPGRWGSKDKFIGIPVIWSQISKAKVIVELELNNFPLDPSLGSHFFHNVIAMKVGYFCIKYRGTNDIINWNLFNNFQKLYEGNYISHYKADVNVIMIGKEQKGYILLK
ncbi:MAG: PEP/pyruvate-binding domain-containing protein [Bacteroidales bacterium]|nr:PEP/pyruvate-binding domain-containing protein [Bacteroidales bacterium]